MSWLEGRQAVQELTAFHHFPPQSSIHLTPCQPLSLVLLTSDESRFQMQTHHISAATPKSVSPYHPSL